MLTLEAYDHFLGPCPQELKWLKYLTPLSLNYDLYAYIYANDIIYDDLYDLYLHICKCSLCYLRSHDSNVLYALVFISSQD